MSTRKERHFHAGDKRKMLGDVEYVEVAESNGKVFVSAHGTVITPRICAPGYKGAPTCEGYRQVSIDGVPSLVHRIVYEIFVSSIPRGMEVDHVDTDRDNNSLSNLRMVTSKENSSNPITRSRMMKALSVSIVKAQLANLRPVVGVSASGVVVGPFASQKDAAAFCGVTNKAISACVRGDTKVSGGYVWKEVANV